MLEGITPDADFDAKFDRLLNLPESYNVPSKPEETSLLSESQLRREGPSLWKSAGSEGDPLLGFLPRKASKLELEWAAQYRALCRAPQGKLPNSGRLSKSKPKVRGSFVEEGGEGVGGGGGNTGMEMEGPEGDVDVGGQGGRIAQLIGGTPIDEEEGADEELGELELEMEIEDDDEDEGELEPEEEEEEEEEEDDDDENHHHNEVQPLDISLIPLDNDARYQEDIPPS